MNKVFVRFPVSEAAMTPGLITMVKKTARKDQWRVRILHPYTLRALESFDFTGTLESAIEAGNVRRAALKKTTKIKYKKIVFQAAPPRGKHADAEKEKKSK